MQLIKLAKQRRGAFLVIALILIIILSSLGIALMSMSVVAGRSSVNYSSHIAQQVRAISMAGYAKRILETFSNGLYYGPGSCNSSTTCNVTDNNFPMSGRPLLPWAAGVINNTMFGSSELNSWWTTNALEYQNSFAGTNDSRVIVTALGSDTISPYDNTYRVVGFASDTATVKTTFQLFHVWDAYPTDPGSGTCSAGCYYAQCCSTDGSCGYDQESCEDSVATYVPPGWNCIDYFVTGLGYDESTCNNQVAPPTG